MTVPPTPASQPAVRLLTPGEVALAFRVDRKTVARWAADGRLSSIRTPGGHRRFREDEVKTLLAIVDQVEEQPRSGSSGT
ncbi:MAG: binding domain, excisionase family [Frankiales bacterium]|nr:binding domain, excisionase family [Frankiales bacterium]